MGANVNWKLTVYGSSVNTTAGTTPDAYDMRTVAITALTSPTTASVFIVGPQARPEITAEEIVDVGGDAIGYVTRRGVFEVVAFPALYDATSEADAQDIDDLVALADVVASSDNLYIRIDAGSRTYPSTTGTVYPVTVRDWNEQVNFSAGTRTLTVNFAHKNKS